MDRPTYQITDGDLNKANKNAEHWATKLAECEAHKDDPAYFKKHGYGNYGLRKRDLCKNNLTNQPSYYIGRGQAIIDRLIGIEYQPKTDDSAYNSGYYAGWNALDGSGMRDYIASNPNFVGLTK